MNRPLKRHRFDVAIHAPLAGALYGPRGVGWTGGAERQSYWLARSLAKRGLRVAHIVAADSQLPPREDGVDLIQQALSSRAPRGTRWLAVMWKALGEADADVYIQRTAGAATGAVGAFSHARGRAFVHSLSSNKDLESGHLHWPDDAVKRLGLRSAHRIVAQTAEQCALARQVFGSKAVLIRSFCEPTSVRLDPTTFLWIGRVVGYKDPLAYIDLAARTPQAKFVMVGTPSRGAECLAAEVERRARLLPNVELLGPRPHEQLLELYARAVAVVSTSVFEGFPNTFMEAWACGVPVLSLRLDPDGVIEREGIGAVAWGNPERLGTLVREYWDKRGRLTTGAAGQQYVRREHDPEAVGDAWMDLVTGLLQQRHG